MSPFRVTLEFAQSGGPPTQAASDRLLARLRAAAPDAEVTIDLGIGRLQAGLTLRAVNPDEAVSQAVAASHLVFGRPATRVDVAPAT